MTIKIPITEAMRGEIMKSLPPRSGWGGYQHLLDRLQHGIKWTPSGHTLELSLADARSVVVYSDRYGEGGYQSRLRGIVGLVREQLAQLPEVPQTGSLFEDALNV